jgi:hypothetical protein
MRRRVRSRIGESGTLQLGHRVVRDLRPVHHGGQVQADHRPERSMAAVAHSCVARLGGGGVECVPIMQRAAAIIGSAIFLVIAPGTLAVYVPWYLTHWHFAPSPFPIARVLGAAPDGRRIAHLARFVRSLRVAGPRHAGARDASQAPRRHRVLSVRPQSDVRRSHGVDRRPGLLFGSVTVLHYGAIVWAGSFLFVVAYEEPALGLAGEPRADACSAATARTRSAGR